MDAPPVRDGGNNDAEPLRCQHPGCTNSVTKPARGRTPKFCDDHKSTSPKSTGTRQASWPKAEQVQTALAFYLSLMGAGVSFIDPFDGRCIAKGKDDVAREIVTLCRPNSKARKVLEAIALPGRYADLAAALVPVIVPMLAHHNLIPQLVIPMIVSDPEIIDMTVKDAEQRREAA